MMTLMTEYERINLMYFKGRGKLTQSFQESNLVAHFMSFKNVNIF